MSGDTLAPDTAKFLERSGAPTLKNPFGMTELLETVAAPLARTGPEQTPRTSGKDAR